MSSAMDIRFIDRTLKTTGIVSLVVLVFGAAYFDIFDVLAVFSGMIWGIVNLYFLSLLVKSALRPEGPDKAATLTLILIKFPLLYLSGYFLIKVPEFDILLLLAGFTSLFAVMFLKVLGRIILGLDSKQSNPGNQQQEAH